MIIKVKNVLDQDAPVTQLTQSVNSGTNLYVQNINQFSASGAVQIGKTGEERAEIKMLNGTTPAGTQLQLTSAVSFAHPEDTPVYYTKFDQVVIKRSTSGTAGAATPLGTVSITPDSLHTIYDDTNGASSYAYKASYRNSVSGDESVDSDWLTQSGYTFYSLAKIRERIKNKLFSANFIKNDEQIDQWINEWLEEMNNAAVNVNQDYSLGTADYAFDSEGYGTITGSDYKSVRKLEVTRDGQQYVTGTHIQLIDYDTDDIYYSSEPRYYYLGDNVFRIVPPESGGTVRITYSKLITVLENETDELPVSMRSFTKTFTDYALSQAHMFDEKYDAGDRFLQSAEMGKQNFISQITPRDRSGPQMMHVEESLSTDYLEL